MKMYDVHSHLGKTSSGEENTPTDLVNDLAKYGVSKVNGPETKPTITLNLLADGTQVDTVELTSGTTTHTFTEVPETNLDASEIVYTVEEVEVPNFTTEITGDKTLGFTVKYTYVPTLIDITVTKEWVNGPETKPTITLNLLADGTQIDTVELTNGTTEHTFTQVPETNLDASEIVYTVEEVEVPNFTAEITGDKTLGFTVTNTYVPTLIDLHIEKVWVDGPETKPSIVVELHANGEKVQELTLENGVTTGVFTGVPETDLNGNLIEYTLVEQGVDNYETSYNGLTITNKYYSDRFDIESKVIWIDAPEVKPNTTLVLMADGSPVMEVVLVNGVTEYVFKDLPTHNLDGTPIEYALGQVDLVDYDEKIEGFVVTNIYMKDTILVDEETGITVKIPYGSFECEVELHIDPVNRTTPNKLTEAYDIYFTCKGSDKRVSPVKELTVTIPFKVVTTTNLEVFHEELDMSRTPISFTHDDKTVTFVSSNFSVYILTSDAPVKLPNTGQSTELYTMMGAALIFFGALLTIKRRRTN